MKLLSALAVAATVVSAPTLASAKMLDPHGIFCGQTLCYDVLEVKPGANDTEIKRNYRRLARALHPDKNPDPDAKKKFNAVSKAYQVLSNEEERAKYDHYLKDPSDYIKKYGHHFFKSTAAQTDLTIVLVLIVAILTGIHYAVLVHQRESYLTKLVAFVIEDPPISAGGNEVAQRLHKEAKEKYYAAKAGDGKDKKPVKKGSTAHKKDEKFKACVEEVCAALSGNDDPNLATPSVWNTFLIAGAKMVATEVSLALSGPTTDEQKELVIRRNLGADTFETLSDDELAQLMERKAWKKEAAEAWMEENGLSDKKER